MVLGLGILNLKSISLCWLRNQDLEEDLWTVGAGHKGCGSCKDAKSSRRGVMVFGKELAFQHIPFLRRDLNKQQPTGD